MGFRKRMRKHELGHDDCRYLNRAIAKYGWENFKCEILFYCNLEQLDYYEKKFIALYNTCHGPGYNLTEGGGGVKGFKHSKETIELISGKNHHGYGKPLKESTKRKLREWNLTHPKKHAHKGSITKRGKRFRVRVMIDKKTHCLGTYDTRELAQCAIDDFVKNNGN